MLGSVQDGEDALQDTLVAAWQGLGGFGERASIRTWLYRIATNQCLNALRAARRRPAKAWDIPGIEPPEPTRLGEVVWLGPLPDSLLDGAFDLPVGPEARYEQSESISLAFVTALQALPPRQLAVLILRDVLGFRANEVAEMLDTTLPSVNSALMRARSGLERQQVRWRRHESSPAAGSPEEDAIVARFVTAYESADVQGLVELLPRPHAGQRTACLRRLRPRTRRGSPRDRPVRDHARRRPYLRDDALREQRVRVVRPTAVTSRTVSSRSGPARSPPEPNLGRSAHSHVSPVSTPGKATDTTEQGELQWERS